jgi:hypothetical protein
VGVIEEFKNTKQFISYVLEHYPDTRNSDTKLYVQCCKLMGAETLDDITDINLNIVTVHKTRQMIQNKEGKFPPDPKIKQMRDEREDEIRNYMRNN